MRILLLLTFLFVSQFAFAEYNTVDYSNVVGDTGEYLNALNNLVGEGVAAQITIAIVSISIIILGLASFRMLVRYMVQKKEEGASVFGLAFNTILIITAVTRSINHRILPSRLCLYDCLRLLLLLLQASRNQAI